MVAVRKEQTPVSFLLSFPLFRVHLIVLSCAGFPFCRSVWCLQFLKLLVQVMKVLSVFWWKFLAVFQLFSALRRVASHYVGMRSSSEHEQAPGMNSNCSTEKDYAIPCLERLKRLEHLVTELNQRSPRIPPEKEKLIVESLNRISSIECDLKKTQHVSNLSTFHYCYVNTP